MLISVMPKRAWSRLSIYAFVVSPHPPLFLVLINLLLEEKEKRPRTALPGFKFYQNRKREKQ
ncbi:MAG: hypothetical protein IKN03_10115 [Fibrobacter sp.]|nr:hypothetical protein [Fibrobacter sp.]